MTHRLPPAARRLFDEVDAAELDLGEHRDFVIGRLLEDGDGEDLRWLTARVPEAELAAWTARRGRRQLSRRAGSFWRLLLAADDSASPEPEGDELWPL